LRRVADFKGIPNKGRIFRGGGGNNAKQIYRKTATKGVKRSKNSAVAFKKTSEETGLERVSGTGTGQLVRATGRRYKKFSPKGKTRV